MDDDTKLERVSDPLPARAHEDESSSGEKTGATTVQNEGDEFLRKKNDWFRANRSCVRIVGAHEMAVAGLWTPSKLIYSLTNDITYDATTP